LNKQLIEKILFNAKTAKIAVVGDFCLDVYWFLNEIASENRLRLTYLPGQLLNKSIVSEEQATLLIIYML